MDSNLLYLVVFAVISSVRCSPDGRHNASRHYDYCILGAGPAGLQMGHFLSKAKRDYVILERNDGPGSFFHKFPRHRTLISINKMYTGRQNAEFNMRHDWNSLLSDNPELLFKKMSREFFPPADALPKYLSMYEKELGLKVRYGVDIGRIRPLDSPDAGRSYVLTDQHGSDYRCSVLLVATGLWVPQRVEFPGWELVEDYESISVDPEEYRDQSVLILGKGNSAFETAQSISARAGKVHLISPNPVRLAWQTHYVGDLRAVNNDVLDTYQLKSQDGVAEIGLDQLVITQLNEQRSNSSGNRKFHVTIRKFLTQNKTSHMSREDLTEHYIDNFALRKPYDRVIGCLGFRFNFSIFDSAACPPKSDNAKGRLPKLTAWYEGTTTPNLYVLGTAAHSRDYRLSAGGFIHGFRYTVRAVHRVLEQRHHGTKWQSTTLMTSQLQAWILKRVGETAGMYQMFDLLGDVIILGGSEVEYVEEFTLQALPHFSSLTGHHVSHRGIIVVVLQYGNKKKKIDFLGEGRAEQDWTRAFRSNFLHPVLYYYDKIPTEEEMELRPSGWTLPRPNAIHHMVEDFLADWDAPVAHIQPLQRFLAHCLQTDLRTYFAESCFRLSLTHRKPPLFCQQGYLKQNAGPHAGPHAAPQWQQRSHNAAVMPKERALGADPPVPDFLAQAAASVSAGLKLDF